MRNSMIGTVLACALGLAACGQSETTFTTPDGSVTATTSGDNGTTTITGPDGARVTFGAGATAADLPQSMPLYPGAKVTTSVAGSNGSQKTVSVAFQTNASVADVIAFYKGKAAALGLGETLNSSDTDSSTFMATKDQTSVIVIASKGTDGTEAQITWAEPPR